MPPPAATASAATLAPHSPREGPESDGPVEIPPAAPWLGLRVPMTREDFELRDWKEGNAARWKFEWDNGFAEAFEERMKPTEIKYMRLLPRAFAACPHGAQGVEMFYDLECWFDKLGVMRKPDFCAFTPSQIKAADAGKHPVPKFVIEILSPRDQLTHISKKVVEYFKAGVQVVWHVNPMLDMVIVFTGAHDAEIMQDDDVCSAAPVFPKFRLKAREVLSGAKL